MPRAGDEPWGERVGPPPTPAPCASDRGIPAPHETRGEAPLVYGAHLRPRSTLSSAAGGRAQTPRTAPHPSAHSAASGKSSARRHPPPNDLPVTSHLPPNITAAKRGALSSASYRGFRRTHPRAKEDSDHGRVSKCRGPEAAAAASVSEERAQPGHRHQTPATALWGKRARGQGGIYLLGAFPSPPDVRREEPQYMGLLDLHPGSAEGFSP